MPQMAGEIVGHGRFHRCCDKMSEGKRRPTSMYDGIVCNYQLFGTEEFVIALHRIALLALLTLSGAALADAPAPVPAPAPAAKPIPKPKTHTIIVDGKPQSYANLPGAPAGGDLSATYQYRTRILGSPSCQRYATESDAAFINDKIDDKSKLTLIKKIGAEAAAAGCLGP